MGGRNKTVYHLAMMPGTECCILEATIYSSFLSWNIESSSHLPTNHLLNCKYIYHVLTRSQIIFYNDIVPIELLKVHILLICVPSMNNIDNFTQVTSSSGSLWAWNKWSIIHITHSKMKIFPWYLVIWLVKSYQTRSKWGDLPLFVSSQPIRLQLDWYSHGDLPLFFFINS